METGDELPGEQTCSYCGWCYPTPVEYHHDEEECQESVEADNP